MGEKSQTCISFIILEINEVEALEYSESRKVETLEALKVSDRVEEALKELNRVEETLKEIIPFLGEKSTHVGELAWVLNEVLRGMRNWKHLAQKLNTPPDTQKEFEISFELSPTEHLFQFLCKGEPQHTIRELRMESKDIHRNDLIQELKVLQSKSSKQRLISGVYGADPRDKGNQVLKIEHSALQELGNQWNLEVKCRPKGSKASAERWTNVWSIYPDATVKVKHNYIELTIPSVEEGHEFAVFGTPEMKDKKRMRMGVFGGKATRGQDWNIFVTLFDDTMMAFEHLCKREESEGRQLLTTLPGLFISNCDKDIDVKISALDEGWILEGSNPMTIKSEDAWNSPENSTDFPCCVFKIAHVDETKQSFFCGVQAFDLNDTAETDLVTFFEQEKEKEVHLNGQDFIAPAELLIKEDSVIEAFVSLLMMVFFVGCLTGTSFDPPHPLKEEETDGC